MLISRVISAAVAIAILVPVLIVGRVAGVAVLVMLCTSIAVWELSRKLPGLNGVLGTVLALAVNFVVVLGFSFRPLPEVQALVVLVPLAILALHLFLYRSIQNTIESCPQMIFVVTYVTVPLCHAIVLARLDAGIQLVFFVLVVVSLGDAGAYFAGKYLGKHHFSAEVSPRKTIEGLVGGLGGNLLGMLILAAVGSGLPPIGVLFKGALLLAVIAPVGDLVASALKRRLNVKDFGTIMPGHGGILDRADALIPAFPVLYYYLVLGGHAAAL